MQHIMTITIIVVGVVSSTLSIVPMIIALRRNRIDRRECLDFDKFCTEDQLREVFEKLAHKYISHIPDYKHRISPSSDHSRTLSMRANIYVLSQLQFLPWMTSDMMKNTVTDVLGLDLSQAEKKYVYHTIKNNVDKCKSNLPSKDRKSIELTFARVAVWIYAQDTSAAP